MRALLEAVTEKLPDFNRDALVLYENFMSLIGAQSIDKSKTSANV
jgi:hypothetical protein